MKLTLLDETRPVAVDGRITLDGIRLDPSVVRDVFGWTLEPQGLCRDAECVPIPPGRRLIREGHVDLATLADLIGRPLASDLDEGVFCLGAPARERAEQLRSLEAPDFTLPDVHGQPHTLSDYRGKKVFLLAWASW
jgi:hypothetical protein